MKNGKRINTEVMKVPYEEFHLRKVSVENCKKCQHCWFDRYGKKKYICSRSIKLHWSLRRRCEYYWERSTINTIKLRNESKFFKDISPMIY
jgi:hypothetical protein